MCSAHCNPVCLVVVGWFAVPIKPMQHQKKETADVGAEALRKLAEHFADVDKQELEEGPTIKWITVDEEPTAEQREVALQRTCSRALLRRYQGYKHDMEAMGITPQPLSSFASLPENLELVFA
eukprot:m.1330 g.1330  ORF g.1330 m.1330 type:complete len:123 (+) comp500_c0_seq1:1331-1699(+)